MKEFFIGYHISIQGSCIISYIFPSNWQSYKLFKFKIEQEVQKVFMCIHSSSKVVASVAT